MTKLVEDVLQKAGQPTYAEFALDTDADSAHEMLKAMTLDDLYVPPGEQLGVVKTAHYAGGSDDPYDNYKLSLYYGHTLVVPEEPDAIFIAAEAVYDGGHPTSHYLTVGFEYISGNRVIRQMVGVVAGSDEGDMDALRIVNANIGTRNIFSEGEAREILYPDTGRFIECVRDLFIISRKVR